jgi:hypothetical protein
MEETYDELPEEAKDRAVEELGDINVGYWWWWGLANEFRNEWLEKYGIDFELDGLCFDLSYRRELYFTKGKIWVDDQERLLSALAPEIALELVLGEADFPFTFYFDTHHYGGGSAKTVLLLEDYREEEAPGFPVDVEEWFDDLCRDFWRELNKEYDSLTSREAIEDTIRVNEYKFTEYGEWIPGERRG